jgi:hypothetical protein
VIESAFLGTITKDPELKTSNAGKAYMRLNVHVGDGDQAQFVDAT